MAHLTQKDPGFYSSGGWGYRETDRPIASERLARYLHDFEIPRHGTALDAGCGDGWWTSLLMGEGFDVTAVDISADAIETAELNWPGPRYVCHDLRFVTDERFDLVFCRGMAPGSLCNVTPYLADDGVLLYIRATDGSGRTKPGSFGIPAINPTVSEVIGHMEGAGVTVYRVEFDGSELAVGARIA